jgi:hypothetical protein
MNNMFRGLLAGAAAYKWGGGCLGRARLHHHLRTARPLLKKTEPSR